MLKLIVIGEEEFDEETQMFTSYNDAHLDLEHSLISLSKWESKFEKPFLGPEEKTSEEILGYVEAMILNPEYPEDVFKRLDNRNMALINDYIGSNQSATTISITQPKGRGRPEVITSELIYYWMVSYNVPFECQDWHLNRLFALLQICNIKNAKPQKMSRIESAEQQRSLNEQRKAALKTSG